MFLPGNNYFLYNVSMRIFFFFFSHRYLLNLNKSSNDAPGPYKEAVVDQWVEWESKSLQASCLRKWNCSSL